MDGIVWAFRSTDAANWFPLTRISHELDVQLFGLDAGWHHLVNVFFHAGVSVLLFAFLRSATRARWRSAFVAFVFALHPLHVESVAWVAERKDVLCTFCWFLALWAYVRYTERPSFQRYALAFLAFVLGTLAKPMIVSLPIVLLIVDFWPLNRIGGMRITRILREKIPFFAVAGALAVATYLVQRASGAIRSASAFPIALRVENALVCFITYIFQTFWPARLAVFYPYPQGFPGWELIVAAALLVGTTIGVIRVRRTHPYLLAGWLWYSVTLLPVIGLVQVGAQAHADRYMYIPMVGLLVMIAWGTAEITSWWPQTKPVVTFAAGATCLACASLTLVQLRTWRDTETLYAHASSVTTGNYLVEHNWGTYLMSQPGRLPDAIEHLQTALNMKPESVETYMALGNALAKSGRLDEAIADYQAVSRLSPHNGDAQSNLGLLFLQRANASAHNGHMAQAIADYEAALSFKPDSEELHYNLGVALSEAGRTAESMEQFAIVLRLAPHSAQAHNTLGVLLFKTGRVSEALQHFEAAIAANPHYSEAQYNLGMALSKAGRVGEALEHFEAAERIDPEPETQQIINRLRAAK